MKKISITVIVFLFITAYSLCSELDDNLNNNVRIIENQSKCSFNTYVDSPLVNADWMPLIDALIHTTIDFIKSEFNFQLESNEINSWEQSDNIKVSFQKAASDYTSQKLLNNALHEIKKDVANLSQNEKHLNIVFISSHLDFARSVISSDYTTICIFMSSKDFRVTAWILLHEIFNVFGAVDISEGGYVMNDDTIIDSEFLVKSKPLIHPTNRKILELTFQEIKDNYEFWWNYTKRKINKLSETRIKLVKELEPFLTEKQAFSID